MRTALNKVRGLGSAKNGTGHFWKQRITAIANIPLTIGFLLIIFCTTGLNYNENVELLNNNPIVSIGMILIILSFTYHMRLGMQTIIEDYIHKELLKISMLILNYLFSSFIMITSIYSILKINFGG
jgi:succinate dehydrogenase / fumarate reductase, membrane anchor subunit